MIANLKEVLKYAEEHKCAIGAFNTPTLEALRAVIDNAEELNVPVIISHAEVHENEAPLDVIGPIMVLSATLAKVPVCVHLDHGEHIDYIERALKLGFTSVMYDGSNLPYEENVKNTRMVVAMARKCGASIEAEIGALASREGGTGNGGAVYTEPSEAKRFVEDTDIDALACSFGTAHGIYKSKPKLDFERIKTIRELIHIPLVMHGGSGLPHEDYIKAMECGVEKINYYSYMGKAGVNRALEAINSNKYTFYHEIAHEAYKGMKEDSLNAMKVFYKK